MNVRFAVVAAASTLVALPGWGQGFQVGAATNISISGLLAVGVKQSEVTNTARPGMGSEFRLDDNTSRLIITSTSKITEGWNVVFRIESRFQADVRPVDPAFPGTTLYSGNITGWADGDTWGGISSPYGTLMFGKSTLYYTDTISVGYLAPSLEAPGESYRIWDDNGLGTFNMLDQVTPLSKTGVGAGSSFTLGNTRSRNVIRFNSVNYSGLDFSVAYSKNPDGDELKYVAPGTPGYAKSYTSGGTVYAGARYNKGPWSASASFLDKKVNGGLYNPAAAAGPQDLQAARAGLSYKFPFNLKVGVVFDHTSIDNAVYSTPTSTVASEAAKRTVFEVPVSYGWGDHAVYATFSKAGETSSRSDTGARQLNLGYDYAMTKRAFIGVFFTQIDNDKNARYTPFLAGSSLGGTANSVAGEKWHQVGINLNYWF